MTTDDIADRVRKILNEILCAPNEDDITEEKQLIEDLGADSLDLVEILIGCEVEFGIEIPNEESDAALTVGDVIKLVRGKVA